jgi:hypothetical protein
LNALLEATEAHSSGGQRILESLTVLETCPDGLSAMRRYGEIHGQDPHRELYVLHTDRETVEIEEVHWAGISDQIHRAEALRLAPSRYGVPATIRLHEPLASTTSRATAPANRSIPAPSRSKASSSEA